MLKPPPLYDLHLKSNAKIVDFAGFAMPINYGSQITEHLSTRQSAGIFDVSHMGVVDITGKQATSFLSYILANDIKKLNPNQAMYSCMCNEEGGILDDLIIYKITPEFYRIVVNANTKQKDIIWLKKHSKNFNIEIKTDDSFSIIALQGPDSQKLLCQAMPEYKDKITDLKKFYSINLKDNYFIARTGYTGEDGFEIISNKNNLIIDLWQNLIDKKVQPVGLGARDSLRLEAGMNLYGTDMDESTTPLDCGLKWTLSLKDERDFIGKNALLEKIDNNTNSFFCGLMLQDKGILRHQQDIYNQDKEIIGSITSGGYSPTLKKSIALARLQTKPTTDIFVKIRDDFKIVRIVKLPFFKK